MNGDAKGSAAVVPPPSPSSSDLQTVLQSINSLASTVTSLDRNITSVLQRITDLEHDLASGSHTSEDHNHNAFQSLFSQHDSAKDNPDGDNDDAPNDQPHKSDPGFYVNPFMGQRQFRHAVSPRASSPSKKRKSSPVSSPSRTSSPQAKKAKNSDNTQDMLQLSFSSQKSEKSKSSVKKKKSKLQKSPQVQVSTEESSDSDSDTVDPQMQQLLLEYQSSKPKYLEDPTTDAIPDPLVQILQTWFWSVYSKDEVKTELGKTLRPQNADALIPTRINEAVFRALSASGLSKDLPCRFIQNAFMKASQPFASVWAKLVAIENHFKANNTDLQIDLSPSLSGFSTASQTNRSRFEVPWHCQFSDGCSQERNSF